MTMGKTVETIIHAPRNGHWVGDGFPVRSLFNYQGDTRAISPFLLLDYAGPHVFEPNAGPPRGVGQHPHRGFETVTIVYDGEVSHRDSSGGGGTIGVGDVQWMTAAGGIIHEEFHSAGFSKAGGPFRVVQLWVNLPAKDKMTPPKYQAITDAQIPVVPFAGGKARVIAGTFTGVAGPATTFTPINLWDVRLDAGAEVELDLPEGHTTMIVVLTGRVMADGRDAREAEIIRFSVEGAGATVRADSDSMLLVLTGEPIDEPVFGYGPFVMTNEAEIHQAIADFNSGRFGQVAH
jgi:redox-sensitive bicupin YhaK (pirin superfamily)